VPTKRYNKPIRLEQLCDELYAAFPEWLVLQPDGTTLAAATVTGTNTQAVITWPDTTPTTAVDAVVAAHIKTPPPAPFNPDERFKAAIATATTLAEMRTIMVAWMNDKGVR